MTREKIRRDGLEVMRENLGKAGMVRVLQQFETGEGDYAKERHDWVDSISMDEIKRRSRQRAHRRRKPAV